MLRVLRRLTVLLLAGLFTTASFGVSNAYADDVVSGSDLPYSGSFPVTPWGNQALSIARVFIADAQSRSAELSASDYDGTALEALFPGTTAQQDGDGQWSVDDGSGYCWYLRNLHEISGKQAWVVVYDSSSTCTANTNDLGTVLGWGNQIIGGPAGTDIEAFSSNVWTHDAYLELAMVVNGNVMMTLLDRIQDSTLGALDTVTSSEIQDAWDWWYPGLEPTVTGPTGGPWVTTLGVPGSASCDITVAPLDNAVPEVTDISCTP